MSLVVPCALAVPEAGLQPPAPTGRWTVWPPEILPQRITGTNGQTVSMALSTISPGFAAGGGRGDTQSV